MLNQEGTQTDTAELAARARTAYEENRVRECLALTKALAQADPGNPEAQSLQSAIRADMQRDLKDARAFLEQAVNDRDGGKRYRKAAEIIILKTLHLDPENHEAKILLQSARGLATLPAATPAQAEDVPFVASPLVLKKEEKKKRRLKRPLSLILIVGLAGGLFALMRGRAPQSNTLGSAAARTDSFTPRELPPPVAVPPAPAAPAAPAPPVAATSLVSTKGVQAPAAAASTPAATPSATSPVPANAGVDTASGIGKLAVSSPTAADIFVNDRYMGSTPTTLQLMAGRRKVEYRHGDLRTVVFHDIKANETTTTSVTFQLTVQINARPWAQVFLDGAPRRPLGQTPLSGITVPVGGVLVFENPNFTSKSYRITERDTAIQVNFP
jgi:cytoskeletal protein RodZ